MAPKRAAARVPAEEPAAKKAFDLLKQRGISRAKYNAITEALEHPLVKDELNEDCRKMLVAMIPQGLCVPADERHENQSMAVRMIGEVMASVEAKLKEAVAAEAATVAAVEASKAGLDAKAAEAEAAMVEAKAGMRARTASLAELSKAMLSARAALGEAEKEQHQGDAEHSAAKVEKDACLAVLGGDFRRLRDGEWEEGQAKNHYSALAAVVGTLSLDESLTSALPSSLMKKPADRGSFDRMVLEQFEASLTGKVAELGARLEAGAPEAAKREAAVEAAKQNIEAAAKAQQAGALELSAAQEKERQAATAVEAAKADVAASGPTQVKAEQARALKQNELECFQLSNIAVYNELRDKVSAQKQKELDTAAKAAADVTAKVPEAAPVGVAAAAVSGA